MGIAIPGGSLSVQYEVTITDDMEDESNEQFQLTLSNAVGGTIANGGGVTVITINDDDDNVDSSDDSNGNYNFCT